MKKLCLPLLILLLTANSISAKNYYISFLNYTIQLADSATAAMFASTADSYSGSFSRFDKQGRMQAVGEFTEQDYLNLAAKEMRTWSDAQRASITSSFAIMAKVVTEHNINFKLPDTIMVIKTHGQEEFGAAGYTRGNAIILNAGDDDVDVGILSHEMFHVLSRHNEQLRDKIYALFGFKKCNPIDVTQALAQRNITNPDCPVISHYITVNGADYIFILYSKKDYAGGSVFQKYVTVSMLEVEGNDNNKKPKLVDGKPVIVEFQNALEVFQQVGTNTDYLLHPEEVCAEHFTFLITGAKVREPEFVDNMKQLLQQ